MVCRLKGPTRMHPVRRCAKSNQALSQRQLALAVLSERQGRLTRFAVNYLVDRTSQRQASRTYTHTAFVILAAALADRGVDPHNQEWLDISRLNDRPYTRISQRRFNDCGARATLQGTHHTA
jgi:hypothetical protein